MPRPPHDPSATWIHCTAERTLWSDAIEDAIREHDAWGLLCTAPNTDVTLRVVLTDDPDTWLPDIDDHTCPALTQENHHA